MHETFFLKSGLPFHGVPKQRMFTAFSKKKAYAIIVLSIMLRLQRNPFHIVLSLRIQLLLFVIYIFLFLFQVLCYEEVYWLLNGFTTFMKQKAASKWKSCRRWAYIRTFNSKFFLRWSDPPIPSEAHMWIYEWITPYWFVYFLDHQMRFAEYVELRHLNFWMGIVCRLYVS